MARSSESLKRQRFGAHLSIAGGVHNAIKSAVRIRCDCLQVFVKNQQQWSAPPLDPGVVRQWRRLRRENDIEPIVAHATYLLNLATPADDLWRKSIDAFTEEIRRCAVLGIGDIIVHPGSHRGTSVAAGIDRVASAVDEVCSATKGSGVRILLETTAGSGDSVGGRFEHLAAMIERSRSKRRLGVCVDTCHIFAAGYDIREERRYEEVMAELEQHVGLQRVRCIHLNDSKRELGSRVDRHEHIGKGKIGRRGFRHIVNDEHLAHVPKILETPKGEDGRGRNLDKMNLAKLRRLIGRS